MAEVGQLAQVLADTGGHEVQVIQEFDHLTEFLSQIPHKVQRAMKMQHELLEMTCLDANQHFIGVGSNIGTVFLYDRDKHTIQRLKSENALDSVTCVALHHGLDDMVAIGYSSGALYIFQLPSQLLGHSKKLERFIVNDLHTISLTSLAWSINGMKLFSGDKSGSVGSTTVDFVEGKCASSMLLIETNTEIVQLHQAHRSLLVATKHRCLVCRMDQGDKLVQVGSKDRKIVGDFGACFIPSMCKPDDAQLFASRPGYRIWRASIDGTVTNTFMYKELLASDQTQIPLRPFSVTNLVKVQNANQFGQLLMLGDKKLVTWNELCLYILDPENMGVVGMQAHIGRIVTVVVTESKEVFVLRSGTDRNLIRLATKPLQKSSAKLLRQLQTERLEAEKKVLHKKELDEDVTIKVACTEKSDDKKQTKEKVSPFKVFQENFVEKVKNIPKPGEIKDIIQEKLKLDSSKTESSTSKYRQSYQFNESKDESFPPGELPPVIQLASPDLLKIEISGEFQPDKDVSVETISSADRFSVLSGAASLETEINYAERPHRTGTGAQSALSRLQEDHQSEIMGRPVYEIAQNASASSVVQSVIPEEDDDKEEFGDIVFSRKTRGKHKKKKGSRERQSKSKDADTVSTTSTTSTGSGTSELSSKPADISDTTEALDPLHRSLSAGIKELDKLMDTGGSLADTVCELNDDDDMDNLYGTEVVKTDANKDNDVDKEKSVEAEKFEISLNKGSDELEKSAVPGIKNVEMSPNKDSGNVDFGTLSGIKKVEIDSSKDYSSVDGNKVLVQAIEPKDNLQEKDVAHWEETFNMEGNPADGRSNLDKEIEKLNMFLNDKPTSSHLVDDKITTNSFDTTLRDAKQFMDSVVIGKQVGKDIKNQATQDGASAEYCLSSLERELQKLEQSTDDYSPNVPNSPMYPESPVPEGPPSIYTIYRHPLTPEDDIYSKYNPSSPTTPMSSVDSSLPNTADTSELPETASSSSTQNRKQSGLVSELENFIHVTDIPKVIKSFNIWTDIPAPANMYSLSASSSHVWFTDRSQNIYYSPVTQTLLSWTKASGSGSQISVSHDGNIVWCLRKNTVYAGTKITSKRPEGLKWVTAVKDVEYICVDETCAWYIKTTGEVMMQKGLSRDRPCYTAQQVDCSKRLRQLACRSGVVWALTDSCQWFYRAGITDKCPEGTGWNPGDSEFNGLLAVGGLNHLFSSISLGDGNIGWALDVVGQVWFCTGVTMTTPCGDNTWWQVPLNKEYLMKDMTTMDMLKSFTRNFDPQKLALLVSAQSGGLISGVAGIWVCPDYKHVLHGCRGNIEGQHWKDAHPVQISASSTWKFVEARNSDTAGIIWAQQPSGDMFAFTTDLQQCYNIVKPREFKAMDMFVCISACKEALWGLTFEGNVFIRRGLSSIDPKGTDWYKLDLSQIEHSHVVHVSCGSTFVWAVDADGNVFHRIGVKAPSDNTLNAAWLPVDNGDTVFTKIVTGNHDWKVWAIDNQRRVFVRSGVTDEMPIGRRWIHVSGTPASELSMSDNFVWALNPSGELLCRYGVSEDNVAGDYWKKLPGTLSHISASPNDVLWGINVLGQLVKRHTKYIIKKGSKASNPTETSDDGRRQRDMSVCSDDGDGWTLI